MFEDVSFNVRAGEIVGFSGLVGAGRTEVGRAIFGADPLDSGEMKLMGQSVKVSSCDQAIRQGIGYMTEDRKALGLYLAFNIRQNLASNRLKDFTHKGWINDRELDCSAEETVRKYGVVTPSIKKVIGQLSGGNQQKVCVARALAMKPRFLFVSEPTRGIDIGAKQLVLETLVKLNHEQKLTIVIVSSELQELRSICDRIAIVSEGRIACILRPDSSDASFGLAMSGAKVNGGDLA